MFARGGVLGLIDRLRGEPMTPALETIGLHKSFGALIVANDIDFRLEAGARHALIGPNGAGKTTFINLVTGRLPPSAGRILLGGDDITALPQAARVRRGLGRTFQINALFRGLSRAGERQPGGRRAGGHRRRHAAAAGPRSRGARGGLRAARTPAASPMMRWRR